MSVPMARGPSLDGEHTKTPTAHGEQRASIPKDPGADPGRRSNCSGVANGRQAAFEAAGAGSSPAARTADGASELVWAR